jgi:hypothetical protein
MCARLSAKKKNIQGCSSIFFAAAAASGMSLGVAASTSAGHLRNDLKHFFRLFLRKISSEFLV